MGSTLAEPSLVEALRAASSLVDQYTDREIASWIVARLNYLTGTNLANEGTEFAHDTNEFGYKIKITDDNKNSLAHGAVVIQENHTYFAAVNITIDDPQSLFVELLTEDPSDLGKIEIRVQHPETQRYRHYGWDGYALLI